MVNGLFSATLKALQMLSDNARKVLSISWNRYRNEWTDYKRAIPYIVLRSGRSERQVRVALNELFKAEYLEHGGGLTRVVWASELQRYGTKKYQHNEWWTEG
jgi:hypothetical protein